MKRDQLTAEQRLHFQHALEQAIEGEVRFDATSRAMYATDASVYQLMPLGVVIPRSRADVCRTLQLCRDHGVSITPRGGGTSQAGQAIGSGLQLDFSKYLNRILEVDPQARTVRVQPGIVLDTLNAHLRPYGLYLPLDISTADRAVIGGMIANNSAGTRSIIYGMTIDYVERLTVLLSDASIVEMHELHAEALQGKRQQDDLEGTCYRTVCDLAAAHAAEIEARYPKIMRRVGGYNLNRFVPNGTPLNMAHMLVGSEGTLGLILEATLRLVPLPRARAVTVVQFDGILEAMAATPHILEHQPSAVELIDKRILNTTIGKVKYEPLRDFIVGDPGAILIVEVSGDSADALPERLDRLERMLLQQGLGHHVHRALDAAAQGRIWSLRRAALGLTLAQTGDAKAISFVEDAAVEPRYLREYVEAFQAILKAHDTEAGFYAHASVGLLHIRPVVDMKTAIGVRHFASIAEQISDLVLQYGGAFSGEHGDGLVRSPFQEKMFGSVLYNAFCTIKRTFDPEGLLNPGKIVYAPPHTANLKFGPQYKTNAVQTVFDFSDFGGLSGAAEQCGNIGVCRKTLAGVMCPSYRATGDETDSTRGRANALRMAISGQLGPHGFTDKALYPVMELCVECKACKTECPTGVDMARMKSEYLHQYQQQYGASWRSRLLAHAEHLAIWGSRLAPVSNWLLQHPLSRWVNEKLLRLDRRRVPPAYARHTFLDWWATQTQTSGPALSQSASQPIALFADTFTNFHEPHQAIAAAQVAMRLGATITVPDRVCCGRPLISKGFLDAAVHQAMAVTQTLLPLAEGGQPIVFCEPSCYSAVRDDHSQLLRGAWQEKAKTVAAACLTFEEWAESALRDQAAHGRASPFQPGPSKVVLHGHCHQKALTGLDAATRLLSAIPQCQVEALDTSCCGMAGSFGYEREHYDISQACGEETLFPAMRALEPNTVTVAPGFSCRHQIAHFTGVQSETPMTLLQRLSRPA